MLRVGEALGRFLWSGGGLGKLVLALGVIGIALSLASAVSLVLWKGAARRLGAATLCAAAATMGVAAAATWIGRASAEAVSQKAALAPARERMLREGYEEARVAAMGGLLLGVFPLVAGAAAVMVGASARGGASGASGEGAASGASVRRIKRRSSARGISSIGKRAGAALLAAVVAAVLALAAAQAKIPGRDLDKAAWALLEHEAEIEAGDLERGCDGLARDVSSLGRAEAASIARDLAKLEEACARRPRGEGEGQRR
jgi:hypothetical protein